MQKVWSISGRSIAVSALALALTACQSMRGPEPVVQADIPTGYIGSATGRLLLSKVIKIFLLMHDWYKLLKWLWPITVTYALQL